VVRNLAALVDHDSPALGAVVWLLAGPHAVGLGHFSRGVAEKGVGDVVLLLVSRVAEGAVGADANDHGIRQGRNVPKVRAKSTMLLRTDRAEVHWIKQ